MINEINDGMTSSLTALVSLIVGIHILVARRLLNRIAEINCLAFLCTLCVTLRTAQGHPRVTP